jgi:hypothetical protein
MAYRLSEVGEEAARCTRCPLYRNATQTVFAEGAATSSIMMVGEQPGDKEGHRRAAFRRTRRTGAESRADRDRAGPEIRLRHQRGQAFQERAASVFARRLYSALAQR